MLIAYGAPATQATAAVIVYHAIAFWIPSLGGVAGYSLLQRRQPRPAAIASPSPTCRGSRTGSEAARASALQGGLGMGLTSRTSFRTASGG
jgi:hypothetical protein